MKPLRALVDKVEGSFMRVELPSGAKLSSVRHPDLSAGDRCWITWDYTRSCIHSVMSVEEYQSLLGDDETEPEELIVHFEDEVDPANWPEDDLLSCGFSDPSCVRVWG